MRYCLITFRSVTPAQKGERVLQNGGLICALQRTPRPMEQKGCGYSLRVRDIDILPAVALLRSHEVAFKKVYLRRENGTLEELTDDLFG